MHLLRVAIALCHDKAMHACGHDAHMAMGLGLAEYVAEHKRSIQRYS